MQEQTCFCFEKARHVLSDYTFMQNAKELQQQNLAQRNHAACKAPIKSGLGPSCSLRRNVEGKKRSGRS